MHASNAHQQCTGAMPIRTDVTDLRRVLAEDHEYLTFRNARAHIPAGVI